MLAALLRLALYQTETARFPRVYLLSPHSRTVRVMGGHQNAQSRHFITRPATVQKPIKPFRNKKKTEKTL